MDLKLAVGIALVAIALRFIGLGQESFWADEIRSLEALTNGVWRHIREVESSPPLFFFALEAWAAAFGPSHHALRAFSALCGGLAAGATFLAARGWRLSRQAALAAAAMVVVSPALYFQCQQNRYYALFTLLFTLWLWAGGLLFAPGRNVVSWRAAIGYAVAGGLCFSTHYYFGFAAVAAGVALVFSGLFDIAGRGLLTKRIVGTIGLAVTMAPWLPLMLHQRGHTPAEYLPAPAWGDLLVVFTRVAFAGGASDEPAWLVASIASVLYGAALGGCLVGALFVPKAAYVSDRVETASVSRAPSGSGFAMFALFVGVVGLSFAVSRLWRPMFMADRYPAMFLPALAIALAAGWASWPRGARRWMLPCATLAVAGLGLANIAQLWREQQVFDWRGAGELIEREWQTGDLVVFHPDWLIADYLANGHTPPRTAPSHARGEIHNAGRVWLFLWEQAPEHGDQGAAKADLLELRASRPAERILDWPVVTLTRIDRLGDD